MKEIKKIKIDPDIHFRMLNTLHENPSVTQREIALKLGISLGGVNYCLKSLIIIGHIKIKNFQTNPNKLTYLYLLTPIGMKEKTLLTADFLKRKMSEYNALKFEIETIKSSFNKKVLKDLNLKNDSD